MIELRNINFRYAGGTDAGGLVNIDLIIPDGQVILLCGQSGCGKTTLTRLVNGLIPNYYEGELSGEVLLDGKNISGLPLYETAKYVGSVFQNPRTQFFTVDSTSELAFGCENQGLPEEEIIQRVKSTAEQFDMDNLLGKNIFSLSGGEKQKIACASVSASNPPIIVLDEPSSNLDMSATKDLRRMIQIWKQQGKTVIIAEHRLYYLKELIDRVVYLKDGKIEKDYLALDALKLSVTQQAEMGLRPFDLGAFPVTAHPVASSGSIECENFHFAYTKQRDALDIDSLSLPQAGVIAVIGHNGAGKSTLARCLCGLEKHCKGIVKVDGKPYNRKQRLSLCYMVMQDVNHQLFTESTEEEMLISMAEPATDKADAVLDRLDLLQFKERHPMALSGGQKQRVAIATALVSERKILVLDEPTSGLDPKQIIEIRALIRELGRERSLILSTHILPEVSMVCDRVLIMNHGRVVASGTTSELAEGLTKSHEVFVAIGDRSRKDEALSLLKSLTGVDHVAVTEEREGYTAFSINMIAGEDLRPVISRLFVQQQIPLLEIRSGRLSLEDIFMKIVVSEERPPAEEEPQP